MPTSINLAISVPGIPSCKPRYGLPPPRLGGSHTHSAYGYYASLFVEADSGVIQVEAKDTADTASRDEIKMHLGHIARAFQN